MTSYPGKLYSQVFYKWSHYSHQSKWLRKLVFFQHKYLPLPIGSFAWLFSKITIRKWLGFYGQFVYQYSYSQRKSNSTFWLSKDSMYWHFYTQTDLSTESLGKLLNNNKIRTIMTDPENVGVELGFGIGKDYPLIADNSNLKRYTAVEPNPFICEYLEKKIKVSNFTMINQSVEEFITSTHTFDILLAIGGVFMYLTSDQMNQLMEKLQKLKVKLILIINEGTTKEEIIREDQTIMFNFKRRLTEVGYQNKEFIEKEKPDKLNMLEYFVMC